MRALLLVAALLTGFHAVAAPPCPPLLNHTLKDISGTQVLSFASRVDPESKAMVQAIETMLKQGDR